MKKVCSGIFWALLLISLSVTGAMADKAEFKAGDEVYTCGCGEGCSCNTVSLKPGKCGCGKDLVKGKVTEVKEARLIVTTEGQAKPRIFNTSAKYSCNCPGDCDCKTISNKPGKCGCGMELK